MSPAGRAAFRAGPWVVLPASGGEGEVWAREDDSWECLELTGRLAEATDAGDAALQTLRGLSPLNPPLGRLAESLGDAPREPLTVGSLLRLGGWDLLFLELTGQCNERCVHCYAESSPERQEALAWDEVEAVIGAASRLGFQTIQLTGGDPLVSKTCLPAARLARDRGIARIEVYTNGLALSDRVADELAEVGVDYSFSFFSHRPEVHDEITGTPGSQVRTLAAIQRALRRGAQVRIGLISTARNREDVPLAHELLVSLGVEPERIGIDEERGVGRGNYVAAGDLVRRGLRAPQLGDKPSESRMDLPAADVGAHGGRRARGGKLCVSYRGIVYPCIFSRSHAVGSIRRASLEEILSRPVRLPPGQVVGDERSRQGGMTCRECREASRVLEAAGMNGETPD